MERETLAAIYALSVKLYLLRPFELVTDNLGVTIPSNEEEPDKAGGSVAGIPGGFDATWVHRPGTENVTDLLSCVGEKGEPAALT